MAYLILRFFPKAVIANTSLPVSLEVFSDDLDEMYCQAEKISSWGKNVYVKIQFQTVKEYLLMKLLKNFLVRELK